MSLLKDILVELQNVVHDSHRNGTPVVWSRDIADKLTKNTDHWDGAGNPGGLHAEEEEDAGAFGLSRRRRDDPEDSDAYLHMSDHGEDELRRHGSKYNDMSDPDDGDEWDKDDDLFNVNDEDQLSARSDRDMSDSEPFGDELGDEEYDAPEDDEEWDEDDDLFYAREPSTEFEEEPAAHASVTKWSQKFLAQTAKERGDCPDCFGTGDQFPDMKTDCETCGGSGEAQDRAKTPIRFKDYVKDEEQEEDERLENPDETDPENVAVDDQYGVDDPNDDVGLDPEEMDAEGESQEWDDPDYQGVIRTVPNAHLVYKRQQEDGSFNELWQYNVRGDFKDELEARRAILAGTDIPINKMRSPDNTQTYELWTVGNGQLMQVRGLPN